MSEPHSRGKPDGAASSEVFESLGKKAEQLILNDATAKTQDSADALESVGVLPNESAVAADDTDGQKTVDEIESLCMNCHENGITRLLLTRIPFFREIIIMSFYCPHCSFKNSEIQSAGEIQQKGSKYELRLTSLANFARQVVKSDTCVVKFIELDIEIPAGRGQLTNVEGLLSMMLEDLELKQAERKEKTPEVYMKLQEILAQGRKMLDGQCFPFRLSLDDPAGNSWIEPDQSDGVGKLIRVEYARTQEQNETLGLGNTENNAEGPERDGKDLTDVPISDDDIVPNEVYSFPATCPGCTRYCVTNMKMVDIPHFKQVVIMSTVCDICGYRSNEVKTGGEVPLQGMKIILKVERPEDLGRDILKSESCALESPELSLSVNPGTLGGRFTTVEGLLTQVRDDLRRQIFDIDDEDDAGDSAQSDNKENWAKFFSGIDAAIKGEKKFTIILTDPLASSYIQNLRLPEEDPQITTEDYKRTKEEEEDLGLRDMKTEGYETNGAQATLLTESEDTAKYVDKEQ